LVVIFNVVLSAMCLVEMQLSVVLVCFRRPENKFPEQLRFYKFGFNTLRVLCATYALACSLIPICIYNFTIKNLASKVGIAMLRLHSQQMREDVTCGAGVCVAAV
jgi:hypothetical protein